MYSGGIHYPRRAFTCCLLSFLMHWGCSIFFIEICCIRSLSFLHVFVLLCVIYGNFTNFVKGLG